MKQILLILAVVALVGCGKKPLIADPIVERHIRGVLGKHTGKLTEADLAKVTRLNLNKHQLPDVKGLEKLNQLTSLYLTYNQLTEVPKGLEKLTRLQHLNLFKNQLTDVTGLENLTQLKGLNLKDNPDLTKAQIEELQKALPKCTILSNPKK